MGAPSNATDPPAPTVWAFAGGKGGVGKSFVAANIAVLLADRGDRVALVDADLGAANLDTILGCDPPERTLGDFFGPQRAALVDLCHPTGIDNLSLIAGDRNTLGSANPTFAHKSKLVRHLKSLPVERVILDLGAGTNFNTLDLYLGADEGFVVTLPEPTALENAFGFMKAATLRHVERSSKVKLRRALTGPLPAALAGEVPEVRQLLERTTKLIVNRSTAGQARRVTDMLSNMARRFLGGHVQLCAVIRDDPQTGVAVRAMTPLVHLRQGLGAAEDLNTAAELLRAPPPPTSPGLNESITVDGERVHVQTETVPSERVVLTQVFVHGGEIVFTRRTALADPFFARTPAEGRARFHHNTIRSALLRGRIPLAQRNAA